MAAAGGEGNARRRRAAGTGRGRPQPAVDSREGSGASGGGAQQQKGGEPAGGATHQGERRRLKQRRRRRGGARRGLERQGCQGSAPRSPAGGARSVAAAWRSRGSVTMLGKNELNSLLSSID